MCKYGFLNESLSSPFSEDIRDFKIQRRDGKENVA